MIITYKGSYFSICQDNLFHRQARSPGAAATARGTAHKELLMDKSSVTREAHHAAPRCLISLHERANGTSLDGEGIQAWLEWVRRITEC
jgi:hypothetical protein